MEVESLPGGRGYRQPYHYRSYSFLLSTMKDESQSPYTEKGAYLYALNRLGIVHKSYS